MSRTVHFRSPRKNVGPHLDRPVSSFDFGVLAKCAFLISYSWLLLRLILVTLEQEDRTRNKSVSKNGGEDREQDCMKMSENVGAICHRLPRFGNLCAGCVPLYRNAGAGAGAYYSSTNAVILTMLMCIVLG